MSTTDTALKIDLPEGQVFHMLSDDGLWLTSVYDGPEGVATVKIGWKDIETARDNYANAADGFESRLPEIVAKIVREQNSKQRLRSVGPFSILIGTGAPIWWLPKVRLKDAEGRWELGFGWLYAVVQISPKDRKHGDASTAAKATGEQPA